MPGPTVKDSGHRRDFESGARRDMAVGKGRFDLLQMFALHEVARVSEIGAIKYDPRNWEKGMPMSVFASSALRHLTQYIRGERDEFHDVQAAWNVLCMIDTRIRIERGMLPKELNDMPRPIEEIVNERLQNAGIAELVFGSLGEGRWLQGLLRLWENLWGRCVRRRRENKNRKNRDPKHEDG